MSNKADLNREIQIRDVALSRAKFEMRALGEQLQARERCIRALQEELDSSRMLLTRQTCDRNNASMHGSHTA